MHVGFRIASIALLSVACASKPGSGKPAEGAESEKFDAEAELARESSGLKPHSFKAGAISFTVPASASPTAEPSRGVIQFTIPIGEGSHVECFLYDESPDTGGALLHMVNTMKEKVTVRELTPEPIEIERDSPIVRLLGIYTQEQKEGLALGQFKLAFHSRVGNSSMCVHDKLGYSKTFRDVSSGFFRSLETGREDLQPSYVEISLGTVGGVPAGFDRVLVFRDGKEERRVSIGLIMMLRSASDIVVNDSASSEVLDPQGRIVSAMYYNSDSGKPDVDVSLRREKGDAYSYRGSFKGKAVEGTFKSEDKRGLPGGGMLEKELARRAKKPGAFSWTFTSYDPDDDPTRPVERTFVRRADDPAERVRYKQGDMEVVGTVDADGRFVDAEATVGRLSIRLQRAHVRGQP